MRDITKDELQEILSKHKLWVNGNEEGERADLRGADLRGADLRGADLRGADLRGADLRGAHLDEVNLSKVNLSRAKMNKANLNGANLRGAYFGGADLNGANLRRTYLRITNLGGANLSGANLREADLRGADLSRVDLSRTEHIPYVPLACPEEGSFIAFKKGHQGTSDVIIKLLIPEDAKRSSATSNKCRCNKAKVIDIQDLDSNSIEGTAFSIYDENFIYEVGKVVEVKDFDENRFNECAPGIHFFINRLDAVIYL